MSLGLCSEIHNVRTSIATAGEVDVPVLEICSTGLFSNGDGSVYNLQQSFGVRLRKLVPQIERDRQ
jgi:hypothetical protein